MATLNDAPFKIIRQVFTTVQNNSIKDILGSDTVSVEHMGYSTEPLRLVCFVQNEDEYDNFKEEYHSSGTKTLIIHENSGRQYTVYGLGSTTEIDGEIENYKQGIVFLATFKQATPYKESTEEITRAKSINTQNQEWSVDDPYINLLENYNWSFEEWSAGPASPPDNWQLAGAGASIARDAVNKYYGTYGAAITRSGAATELYQYISDPTKYIGKYMTLACRIKTSTAGQAGISFYTDQGSSVSSLHTGSGNWELLTVTRKISAGTTIIRADIEMLANDGTAYFDGVILIEGTFIPSSGKNIATEGNVDAVPDIQATGGTTHAGITQTETDSNYNTNNSLSTVTITQAANDPSGVTLNSSYNYGQTINCRKAGMAIIDSFQIHIQSVATAGDVTCTVYDGVGGTALGSKVVNIAAGGLHTFTFATPIAVVQSENTCADSTEGNKIYFKITVTGSTSMTLYPKNGSAYTDGIFYQNDGPVSSMDMKFVVSGHSCKEIRQTFEVDETCTLASVILNICKYNYSGSNAVTVAIKDGGTLLGTGTAVLTGTTFAEVDFIFEEETAHSLELSSGTVYTMIITPPSDSANATAILIKTKTSNVYADGAVTLIEDGGTSRVQTHDLYFQICFPHSNENVQIYNITDTTVKCNVANEILESAIHRINTDGTGTIDYDDDFTTQRYGTTREGMKNITHDEVNDELDIADDGYIYWPEDTKYPIIGTPTLTARINITAGIPTIQISTDASTWYDIDTAIVDDVETVYPLDSDGNLSLAGKTVFYWRIDCVKAAAATCSIKSFELDIAIHTIYAKNPKITKGASASTFRCDQDPDSGLACEVALIFRHRWWT